MSFKRPITVILNDEYELKHHVRFKILAHIVIQASDIFEGFTMTYLSTMSLCEQFKNLQLWCPYCVRMMKRHDKTLMCRHNKVEVN